MYVIKGIEKKCCTCDHWAGLRALEEGGFIYSLENVEGICKGAERGGECAEFDRTLTAPTACCASWEKWADILSCTPPPQAQSNARGVTAYSV